MSKNKIRLHPVIYTFLLFAAFTVEAQEIILPLEGNPVLENSAKKTVRLNNSNVMLELPVYDDFSYAGPYPDINIWADDYAFINSGYAVDPPSIGVATLDALDWNGTVYPFATISPSTFDADFLTSYPINLNMPASDSIYLSFFYQPMGTGLAPQPYDSLCLDFYNPTTDKWTNIWRAEGDSLKPFKQILIPIKDTSFLKEGFRFEFRNKASLPKNDAYADKRGNVDHWNIDYVRLYAGRSSSDTIIRDVAFTKPLNSMLYNYESIPWDHFIVAYNTIYRPKTRFEYRNNDSATRNVSRNITITDPQWNESFTAPNASTQDILPGNTTVFEMPNIYPFSFSRGDTAHYEMMAWLRTDEFDNKNNDTIYRTQVFKDYFAYDDGSAERAYGLRGQGTNYGLMAVRFNSFIADELGGVDLYFTQLKDSLNLEFYFKLMVWDDFEGMPGNLIYEDDIDYTVVYSDRLNLFSRYEFAQPVNIEGPFYVGLMQYNQSLLNIGLDINTPANGNLLFNLGSEWQTSSAPGSLMLRPFVKRNYSSSREIKEKKKEASIYPNPASDYIQFQNRSLKDLIGAQISIHDLSGKKVLSYEYDGNPIPVNTISSGIYILSVRQLSGQQTVNKLIIRR